MDEMVKEQLGFIFWPINRLIYRKLYLKWYNCANKFPNGYKVDLNFFFFSEDDGILVVEHACRYLV